MRTFRQYLESKSLSFFNDEPAHHMGLGSRMANSNSGKTQQFIALLKKVKPEATKHLMRGTTFSARELSALLGPSFQAMIQAGFLVDDGDGSVSVNM